MAPSLVQSVSASGNSGTSLSLTLGSATTAGNCLIACIAGDAATTNPAVTGITLGGSAGNFAQALTAGGTSTDAITASIWADPNCTGGQTAVSVTFTVSGTFGICVTVMEWSGLAASSVTDKTASQVNDGSVTSWSSTATATTSQASEVAIGCVGGFNGSGIGTITGPSSPWTNITQKNSPGGTVGLVAGWQVLSSTGTVTYSGTQSAAAYTAAVATFKAAAGTTVALTTPNLALAAPLVTAAASAGTGAALTAPGVALAAPALAVSAGATVALTAPGAALAAPPLIVSAASSFPRSPLDLRMDLSLGGTWTGVPAALAYQRDGSQPPVVITRGKPDESSTANPAACAWQWNNRDGRFSPRNPTGPYYGQLGRNTPVRWSLPATSNYLRLEAGASDCALTADTAALHVSGSLEARVALRLSDWRGCALACRADSVGTASWGLLLRGDGTMRFFWYDSGNTEHQAVTDVPLPYTGGDFAVKVTMDATTGTVAWYTAASIDGTYAQLGDAVTVTGSSTSVRAGSDPLRCGWSPDNFSDIGSGSSVQMYGRAYEVRLYNGIGGTLVAAGVFSSRPAGATSWTGADGLPWSVSGGAEISDRDYRFHGEMSQLPPRWDVTGTDHWVAAQAGGPLRRLQQGTRNAVSALKRAILSQAGSLFPVAYWPMEDASAAAQFGSATGGPALTWTGGPPDVASDSTFLASAPLPGLNGAVMSAGVPSYTGGTAWALRFPVKLGATVPAGAEIARVTVTGGACAVVQLLAAAPSGVQLVGLDGSGSTVFDTGVVSRPDIVTGQWISVEATPSGGSTLFAVVNVSPGATTGLANSATVSGTFGNVTGVALNTGGLLTDTVIGHVQVQSAWVSMFTLGVPLNAWQGETAAARYARLAGENGYAARVLGSPAYSAAMGAQGQATLAALLAECESADMGQQHEPRQQLALGYRTLASMLSQSPRLTLDYGQSQPGGVSGDGADSGLDPSYDDLLSKNDWTVTRGAASGSQGATVQVTLDDGSPMSISDPPAGMGDYANTATVNVQSDGQLQDVAGWLVHVGTVDDLRWPVIPVNLGRTAMSALQDAAAGLDAGDMLQVSGPPALVTYDAVRQLALGFRESLGGFWWTCEYNAVPAAPYDVIVLGDPVLGRLDTDGSALAAGVTSSATTLSVATTGTFPLWTTSSGDFPFDVAVGGERMTVTGITGTSSPQSFTVTRSVNGVVKAQSSGADVRLWTPPVLAVA